MPVRIHATWLVVVAGLVSTGASLGGGLFLYYDSKALVESTVEQIGTTELLDVTSKMARPFEDAYVITSKLAHQVYDLQNLTSDMKLVNWWIRRSLARILIENEAYSRMKLDCYHAKDLDMWFSQTVERGEGGRWTVAQLNAWPDPSCKNLTHAVESHSEYDPFTDTVGAPYSSRCIKPISTAVRAVVKSKDWYGPGAFFDPRTDSSHLHAAHFYVPPPPLRGLWGNTIPGVAVMVKMSRLGEILRNMTVMDTTKKYRAEVLLLEVDAKPDPMSSMVFAGTLPEFDTDTTTFCKSTLTYTPRACSLSIRDLSKLQREVVYLNSTKGNLVFQKKHGYWMTKSVVLDLPGGPWVQMNSLYLMWFLPSSEVDDEINQALVKFIAFLVVVCVFDTIIGLAEVYLIARPLKAFAASSVPLQSMDLDNARLFLAKGLGCLEVSEVSKLRSGLMFAIASIEEYKSYLPCALFVDNNEDTEVSSKDDTGSVQTSKHSASMSRTSGSTVARMPKQVKLQCLQVAKVTVMLVRMGQIKSDVDQDLQAQYGDVVGGLNAIWDSFRGVVHQFFALAVDTLMVTWQGTVSGLEAACNAGLAAKKDRNAIAVVSGKCYNGNLGTKSYRGLAYIGKLTKTIGAILQFAAFASKELSESVILANHEVKEKLLGRLSVDAVCILVAGGNRIAAYEVGEGGNAANEEWMYELEKNKPKTNPLHDVVTKALASKDGVAAGSIPDDEDLSDMSKLGLMVWERYKSEKSVVYKLGTFS